MKERGKKDYVTASTAGGYVYLSKTLEGPAWGRVDLYEGAGGSLFALKGCPSGQMELPGRNGGRRMIHSHVLAHCLSGLPVDGKGHVPACYDAAADAILVGAVEETACFDQAVFRRLDVKCAHRLTCAVTPDFLRVRRAIQTRSEAMQRGHALAFCRANDGSVVLERSGEDYIVRKPEVVAFARTHWGARQLFYRKLDNATVVSSELLELIRLENLAGFVPLRTEKPMTVSVGRGFRLSVSQGAAAALGRQVAVYACGPYLALAADESGDIRIKEEGGGNYIDSLRLCQQLTMRFPGAEALDLIPHGELLIFCEGKAGEMKDFPPADYFCRLLMIRERTAHLMRYGVSRSGVG